MTISGYHQVAAVAGGAGIDTLVLQNTIVIHDVAAQITGVEKIDFSQAGDVIGTDDADNLDFETFQLVGARGLAASGGNGNDHIVGTSGNDLLYGQSGNDVIEGGLGNDHIIGGVEQDFSSGLDYASYEHATGAVHVTLATDLQQDTGSAGLDQLEQVEGLIGSAYGDTLTGSDRADSLIGGAGADTLNGGLGDDMIDGDDDADTINGGIGSDTITGGKGDDVIDGGGLRNQDPTDPNAPAPAADVLKGGVGADTYVWGSNLDLGLYYAPDNHNQPVMKGGGLVSQVEFKAGEGDRLSILAGQGLTFLGEGVVSRDAHGSIAYVQNTAGTLVSVDVDGDGHVDSTIQLDHHVDLVETAPRSGVFTGLNRIDGTAAIDHLTGTNGDDSIHGLGGPDWLEGGLGNDRLDGGEGDDTASYVHAAGGVHVDLGVAGPQDTGSAGMDTLVSIESVTGSAFNDTLTGAVGNSMLETIQGRDGNDVIEGHGGYDQLVGGAGADTYVFNTWSDWNVGEGKGDQFGGQLQLDGQDRIAMDGLGDFQFMGHNAFDASGQFEVRFEVVNNNSTLIQADVNGDGHADYNYWVQGGTALAKDGQGLVMSNDAAVFTTGTDGADAITGTLWNDQIAGLSGNDRIAGYDGDDQLFGQAGNDKLFGQNGNDLLIGGDNDDLLDGGIGNDRMMGGTGNDVFQFSAFHAGDYDTILDFQGGEKIDLHALDANSGTPQDEAFNWLGYNTFSGHAGELRMSQDGTGQIAYLSGDVDGDGHADFTIEVHSDHLLMANDFLL